MKMRLQLLSFAATILGLATTLFAQSPLGTDFTYQGKLMGQGIPAISTADFQFALFDAGENGSQIGAQVSRDNVAIVEGLFKTSLDFGTVAFNGNARWLEVAVRSPAGTGSFTTLSPRQPITAAPYALKTRGIDGHSLDGANGSPVDAVFVDNAGHVGIGTTQPSGTLQINGVAPSMFIQDTSGQPTGYIQFSNSAGNATGYLGFDSNLSPDFTVRNIREGGNIVLYPGAGGAVSVPVLEITGADLAEKFPTSEKIEPGQVVAIDAKNAGKLCLARGAYNPRVAGVVSGANNFAAGAVLGNLPGHKDAPPIALSGRVYVWCDASGGAIEPGNLLTTSDTPGHAMKATDHTRAQGAVIGKAMTSLAKGERGLVLTLVSLQ